MKEHSKKVVILIGISREEFNKWVESDKFKEPTTKNGLYDIIFVFFKRIERIPKENHKHKFDGRRQILAILNRAAKDTAVKLYFTESDGQWYIHDIPEETTKDDILNLPLVAERFSKIYRFYSKKYSYQDNEDIKVLTGGD